MSKVDWHKDQIEDNTLVTSSYKSTQNVRRYFKAKCGDNLPGSKLLLPDLKG